MQVLFLEAPFSGEVNLCEETLSHLKKKGYKKVALYASIQFCHKLENVKKQLDELGVTYVSSQPDRTNAHSQLLGCDNYHDSLNLEQDFESYLYVGDGKFHPLALVYGQKDIVEDEIKEIIRNDPLAKKMFLIDFNEIKGILKRYRGSLIKFLSSQTVGIINTIKPGQEQFKPSKILEKKYPNKKFYHFIDNVISFDQLENFNFIDVWVNSSCPRVGFDDQEKFERGVVNLNDAFKAAEILGKDCILNNL